MTPSLVRAAAAALVCGSVTAARAAAQTRIETRIDTTTGWGATGTAIRDFTIARDTTDAPDPRRPTVSVRVTARDEPDGFAGIATGIDAVPYAGRRVRMRALLRAVALDSGGGVLWLRADADGRSVAFVGTHARPIRGTTGWTPATVELDVPRNAQRLVFGAFSQARGTLRVGMFDLEPAGDTTGAPSPVRYAFGRATPLPFAVPTALVAPRREPPRLLTARGRENLMAFTRLLGDVRFFHPADEALDVDWNGFAVRGVRAVEQAPTPDSLAATLRALFAPVAPRVAVYRTGSPPPAPPDAPAGPTPGVVQWAHFGLEMPNTQTRGNAYRSRRVRADAPGGRVPDSLTVGSAFGADVPGSAVRMPINDPRRPLHVDLGGGVSASVPLALWTDRPSLPDSLLAAHPRPSGEYFSPRDRATHLADVALTWTVMQHFYPYFDVVGTDWEAQLPRALDAAATAPASRAGLQSALEPLVAALHDGHGNVWVDGGAVALAPVALVRVEGRIVVGGVGDSARAAGVRPGDEVVTVDGRPADAAWRDVASRVSGATPQWVDVRALGLLAAGAPGSRVVLGLRAPADPHAPVRTASLARGPYLPLSESKLDKVAEPRPGIVYVDLGRVTDEDVTAALPRLRAARGIVFDMRGYPSRVNTARVLAMLGDSGMRTARFEVPVVTRPDRAGWQFVDGSWPLPAAEARLRAPVAFLTGGGAISYAETTMGIVEAYHLGAIVGGATAGTNGNVDPFDLPGGAHVTWTGMRVRKHDGSPHHGVGIRPTVPVAPTLRGVREGRDEVLERALDLLSGRPTASR